jgi:hypothetical protein
VRQWRRTYPMAWIVVDLYAAQTVGVGFHWFWVKARHHDCLLYFYSTARRPHKK